MHKKSERNEQSLLSEIENERSLMRSRLENETTLLKNQIEELNSTVAALNKKLEQEEKKFGEHKMTLETELALSNQKLKFLEQAETDWSSERKRLMSNLRLLEEENRNRLADLAAENNKTIAQLKDQLTLIRNQKDAADEVIQKKDDLNESMAKDFNEKELQLKSFLASKESMLTQLKQNAYTNIEKSLAELKSELEEKTQIIKDLEALRKGDTTTIAQLQEQAKLLKIELERETGLRVQAEEISNIRGEEVTALEEEFKKLREQSVLAFSTRSDKDKDKSEIIKQFEELRRNFEERTKKMQG